MKFPLEELMPYPLAALFVLAVFYGIYFAKKHCTLDCIVYTKSVKTYKPAKLGAERKNQYIRLKCL